MNKPRRIEIEKIISEVKEIIKKVQICSDIEQENFDRLPKSLQLTSKGAKHEMIVDLLDYSLDYLTLSCNYLEKAIKE